MLNTSLSVEAHKAGSHANQGWEQFTGTVHFPKLIYSYLTFGLSDAIINYLNTKKSNIVFMLWGAHAQKKGARINKEVISLT